ncbi:hypothetical protein [Jeotgalicoccus nanhaiensis]|nr:hypothetical protein [Jeotgalicoccus nanhaiensis]
MVEKDTQIKVLLGGSGSIYEFARQTLGVDKMMLSKQRNILPAD